MKFLCIFLHALIIASALAEQKRQDKHHQYYSDTTKKSTKSTPSRVENSAFWFADAVNELTQSITRTQNNNVARNVVIFLGDGMNVPTITAARIYKGQQQGISGEEFKLSWDDFPDAALIKTYSVNKQVPDSASTATAYLCGSKTNYYTVGVDATAEYENCTSVTDLNKLTSIGGWALEAGKKAGFVTSTRVTHATPSGMYAHSASRDWECDSDLLVDDVPTQCPDTKDIARQLVEDWPGNEFSVIMGGGYALLTGNATSTEDDYIDPEWDCVRSDGLDLFQQWQDDREAAEQSYAAVRTKSELLATDTSSVDRLMGIFSNAHLQYEWQKREKNLDVPTLAEMTRAAIEVLQKGPEGFVLLVEGGLIDWSHHDNQVNTALDEAAALDDAVQVALELLDTEESLIVVTADHGHTLTINGYPERGNDIRGTSIFLDDHRPLSTLTYSNGPGYDSSYKVSADGSTVKRHNLMGEDFTPYDYVKPAGAPKGAATHSGEDVAVFAKGPMSHLFQGVHEQNYIAHVMAYAACIGPNTAHCDQDGTADGGAALPEFSLSLLFISALFIPMFCVSHFFM